MIGVKGGILGTIDNITDDPLSLRHGLLIRFEMTRLTFCLQGSRRCGKMDNSVSFRIL